MFFIQILLNSLVIGTQVLLLAIPLYLVYSVSKIYHLALGAIGISMAYAVYFGLSLGWPIALTILVAVAVSVLLSTLSYKLLEASARKQEDMFGLLISFSLGIAIESIIAIMFGTDGKFLTNDILPTINFGSVYMTVPGLITTLTGLFLAIVFAIMILKTPWGRNLRSISENSSLAASLMINASKVRCYIFIIAGLIAGFIGTMLTLNTALTPQAGFYFIILAFVALLIGGVNNIKGTIIAAYIVTLIPELLIGLSGGNWNLTSSWKMVIVFILAVILLIWRPQGLLSSVKQRID